VRACAALFARRPQDIVRVYLSSARQREFATLLTWCGRERKGFQVVAAENLQRLTGSLHHEGVAILAKSPRRLDMADLLRGIEAGTITGPLVYLDGVQNPHNLGTILRTAAHFGAGAILGRLGHVPVADLADPLVDLARLKVAGFQVVATTSHAGQPLFAAPLGERLVIVLGSEGEGMSRPLAAAADLTVQIPGTGAVESLNVSVAAGILLGEAWRRRPPASRAPRT